jgi:cyclophilin family peptidyl-prolyl cis-trans isomerase
MALFTDGEPLDVAKLNSLATSLDSLTATVKIMTNAYNAANKNRTSKVPVVETGFVTATMSAGTKSFPINVNYQSAFGPGENPTVVAMSRTAPKTGQYINVSVTTSSTNPLLWITSNQALSNSRIDWIAVYMKPINT